MIQLIIAIDVKPKITADELAIIQSNLVKSKTSYIAGRVTDTKKHQKKTLVLVLTSLSKDDLLNLIDGLNPVILAVEGEKIDHKKLLPYFINKDLENIDGILQTFAGHKWTY